jgi:ClpP class serine protease
MDTPGGSVTGVSDFAQQVAASKKPLTAHVIGMAESAGYWIASQADRLTSVDTGTVGSIGVVAPIVDYSEAEEKRGIKSFDIVSKQSPRKRTDLKTAEGQKELQAILNGMADLFISAVASGRNVDTDKVLSDFGKGGSFVAADALKRGMIDEVVTTASLVSSLGDNNQSLYAGAAAEPQPKGEETMDVKEDKNVQATATAPDLDKVKSDAIAAERERIQSIEAVKNDFSGDDQKIQAAVQAVIDEKKFDTNETAESVKIAVMQVALDAQREMIASAGNARRELATKLEVVPTGNDDSDELAKKEDPNAAVQEDAEIMAAGLNKFRNVRGV